MKEIKLSELKKMYPKHKKTPEKQKPFYPEDLESCSQAELREFARQVKKKQENQVTYYPEHHDETKGIYSRAVVLDDDELKQ